jgi:tripartite-type tricarboxylate transporter receptor subunit TctC
VRLVVPFAPGGSSEIVARSTAAELAKTMGQSVFVDNKPGAAGNIAMQEVARSDDQHTLILGHIGTLAVNPFIFDKLPYDANKDFKPVSAAGQGAQPVRGAPRPAGEEPQGVHRLRQEEPGQAQLRLGGQRQRRPPGV